MERRSFLKSSLLALSVGSPLPTKSFFVSPKGLSAWAASFGFPTDLRPRRMLVLMLDSPTVFSWGRRFRIGWTKRLFPMESRTATFQSLTSLRNFPETDLLIVASEHPLEHEARIRSITESAPRAKIKCLLAPSPPSLPSWISVDSASSRHFPWALENLITVSAGVLLPAVLSFGLENGLLDPETNGKVFHTVGWSAKGQKPWREGFEAFLDSPRMREVSRSPVSAFYFCVDPETRMSDLTDRLERFFCRLDEKVSCIHNVILKPGLYAVTGLYARPARRSG